MPSLPRHQPLTLSCNCFQNDKEDDDSDEEPNYNPTDQESGSEESSEDDSEESNWEDEDSGELYREVVSSTLD